MARTASVRGDRPRLRRSQRIVLVVAALMVAVTFAYPRLRGKQWHHRQLSSVSPLYAGWQPQWRWAVLLAVAFGVLVSLYGPQVAARLRLRWLLPASWFASLVWTTAFLAVQGWHQVGSVLTELNEYLHEVPGLRGVPVHTILEEFTSRILRGTGSWTTHVAGHPPGALLTFVLLDRTGLTGGGWAAALCVLVGTAAVPALLLATGELAGAGRARRAAPFLVLMPAVLWIGVSADGMFLGVTAWGLTCVFLATGNRTRRIRWSLGLLGGLLLGLGCFLSYGLVTLGVPALAVIVARRRWSVLVVAVVGALVVLAAFTAGGFWWLDGYHLLVRRYYQGIGATRSYAYWLFANPAAQVVVLGAAVVASLPRLGPLLRRREPLAFAIAGCVVAMLVADLSGLSKAETERIWMPFSTWLVLLTAWLPDHGRRGWLLGQVAVTTVISLLLVTPW